MKRVRHFTATGQNVRVKLTMEIETINETWNRKSFLSLVEHWSGRAMIGLSELGFPLTKIKQSTVRK